MVIMISPESGLTHPHQTWQGNASSSSSSSLSARCAHCAPSAANTIRLLRYCCSKRTRIIPPSSTIPPCTVPFDKPLHLNRPYAPSPPPTCTPPHEHPHPKCTMRSMRRFWKHRRDRAHQPANSQPRHRHRLLCRCAWPDARPRRHDRQQQHVDQCGLQPVPPTFSQPDAASQRHCGACDRQPRWSAAAATSRA